MVDEKIPSNKIITFNIPKLTKIPKILIIANFCLFFFINIFSKYKLADYLVFDYNKVIFNYEIWRFFTYSFVHFSGLNLFFNCFILWFFGSELEYDLGKKKFLSFYLVTVFLTSLILFLFKSVSFFWGINSFCLGLITMYALFNPNKTVYFMFVIPVKMKWMIVSLIAFDILSLKVDNQFSDLTFLFHISGIISGLLYVKVLNYLHTNENRNFRKKVLTESLNDFKFKNNNVFDKGSKKTPEENKNENFELPQLQTEIENNESNNEKIEISELNNKVDFLLDKIKSNGMDSLSLEEKNLLKKASYLFKKNFTENKK
jgi:membrane associated rhomboid family serine protease